MFEIHFGIPEMQALWDDLKTKNLAGTASKDEIKLYNKLGKAARNLSKDPRYPGLQTHEISSLTARYGMKVWQSYLEKNTPGLRPGAFGTVPACFSRQFSRVFAPICFSAFLRSYIMLSARSNTSPSRRSWGVRIA